MTPIRLACAAKAVSRHRCTNRTTAKENNSMSRLFSLRRNRCRRAPALPLCLEPLEDRFLPASVLAISDAAVIEGGTHASTQVGFTISLSAASNLPVKVAYKTVDNTAIAPADYQAAAGTILFNPGETSKSINVTVVGDTTDEQDE